jgi:hypothetical protein
MVAALAVVLRNAAALVAVFYRRGRVVVPVNRLHLLVVIMRHLGSLAALHLDNRIPEDLLVLAAVAEGALLVTQLLRLEVLLTKAGLAGVLGVE